jgi:hypothetical protein
MAIGDDAPRCPHHFICPPPWEADADGAVEAVCRRCGERRRLSVRLTGSLYEEAWTPREAEPSD